MRAPESSNHPAGSLCLIIDTAAARCAAAILDMHGMRIVGCAESLVGKGHAEILMGQVDTALAEAGKTYADLTRIGVTVGPGSFTGVRVGISAARGLALALGIPVVGVGVLEALAYPLRGRDAAILAVQDARRGEVFVALYDDEGAERVAPAAVEPDEIASVVAGVEGPLLLAGSGAELVRHPLAKWQYSEHYADGLPDLGAIAALAAGRAPREPVQPLYLRGADAKPQARSAKIRRKDLSEV